MLIIDQVLIDLYEFVLDHNQLNVRLLDKYIMIKIFHYFQVNFLLYLMFLNIENL